MCKKQIVRIIQDLVTVGLWGYFIRSLFYIDKTLLIKISGVAAICFTVISAWRIYNYRRFKDVHRRQFPQDTTIEDVSDFFGIEISTIEQIHNTKMIVLEKNILTNRKEENVMCKEISTVEINNEDLCLRKDRPEYYKRKLQELVNMARSNGLEIELSDNNISFSKYIKESAYVEV